MSTVDFLGRHPARQLSESQEGGGALGGSVKQYCCPYKSSALTPRSVPPLLQREAISGRSFEFLGGFSNDISLSPTITTGGCGIAALPFERRIKLKY